MQPRAGRGLEQAVVHGQIPHLLMVPGQTLADTPPTFGSHDGTTLRVAEELVYESGEARYVVWLGVDRLAPCGGSRLSQVKGHDRDPKGHVLHRLDCGRDVGPLVSGIGLESHIRSC